MERSDIQKNTPNFLKKMDLDLDLEEILLFPNCVKKILANIDKSLLDPKMNRMQITRLLTCRWLLTNGLK